MQSARVLGAGRELSCSSRGQTQSCGVKQGRRRLSSTEQTGRRDVLTNVLYCTFSMIIKDFVRCKDSVEHSGFFFSRTWLIKVLHSVGVGGFCSVPRPCLSAALRWTPTGPRLHEQHKSRRGGLDPTVPAPKITPSKGRSRAQYPSSHQPALNQESDPLSFHPSMSMTDLEIFLDS